MTLFRGRSSIGRAPALQAGGRRFDPVRLHDRSLVLIYLSCGGCSNPVNITATGSSTITVEGVHFGVLADDAIVTDATASINLTGTSNVQIIGNLIAANATIDLTGSSRLTVGELVARTIGLVGSSTIESRYD